MSDGNATRAREPLAAAIETIERSYEYLLAYAAQGRRDDAGTEVRATLQTLHAVLADFGPLARRAFRAAAVGPAVGPAVGLTVESDPSVSAYLDAVERDAQTARGAVGLVLGRPRIGSLLIDNLNASVHLRALLTDAFLLDQALENS